MKTRIENAYWKWWLFGGVLSKTAGVLASRLPPLCSPSWHKQYNCCPRYNVYPLALTMDVGDRAPVIAVGIRFEGGILVASRVRVKWRGQRKDCDAIHSGKGFLPFYSYRFLTALAD